MRTNYVLIDYENVQPDDFDLLDQEWIKVFVFVGKNQVKLPFALVKAVQRLGTRAQYVEMSGTGHNALDFHIAFYVGRLSAIENDAFFHVISNDTGFDPLISHLKAEHILADRVSKIEDIPALASNRILSKPIGEKVALVRDRLAKSTGNRPRSRKTLTSHVAAMFLKSLPEEELTSVVDALMSEGVFRENGKRIEYADE